MIDATPPSTAKLPDDTYSPSLKNPAVALCNEAWLEIHGAVSIYERDNESLRHHEEDKKENPRDRMPAHRLVFWNDGTGNDEPCDQLDRDIFQRFCRVTILPRYRDLFLRRDGIGGGMVGAGLRLSPVLLIPSCHFPLCEGNSLQVLRPNLMEAERRAESPR